MKKSIIIITILSTIFLLVSCSEKKEVISTSSPTVTIEQTSHDKEESNPADVILHSINITNTRKKDGVDITNNHNAQITYTDEETQKTTSSKEIVNEVPPYILSLTVNDIRKIKSAAETMTEEDFLRYMDENYIDEAMNGLDSRENAEKIFDELEDRYVIVYNEKDMGKILTCYIESGYLHQRIFLDENQYLNIRLYADEESAWQCEDGEKFKLLKTYSHENAEFEVMESFEENGKQYLCVNVIIGEQRMNFFTGEEMSLEEFEKVLSDIEIVKIGDLLDDPEFSTEG